ncbi:hypothetical protein GCM10020256_27130 [Streptomyces thermocoprophilus]
MVCGYAVMKASANPVLCACSSQIRSISLVKPRHGSGSASASRTAVRQARRCSAKVAVSSSRLAGKCRYSVAGPTPARRATSRTGAPSPSSPNTARAASRMRARLSRASERAGRVVSSVAGRDSSLGIVSHFAQADGGVRYVPTAVLPPTLGAE